jgi:imidazole glycerol-phosphate synthase subunit HisH
MMNRPRVAVIDYGMGNVWSVMSALKYLGVEAELLCDPDKLVQAHCMILPGVGSFRKGMEALKARGLDESICTAINSKGSKILGICLGMQLLGSHGSEDGNTAGLGLIANSVKRFTPAELRQNKIPHVGFNPVCFFAQDELFRDLPELSDFYFAHSYRMLVDNIKDHYAVCSYGSEFLAAFQAGNVCGVQFHPEKSQTNGLILLRNFLKLSSVC